MQLREFGQQRKTWQKLPDGSVGTRPSHGPCHLGQSRDPGTCRLFLCAGPAWPGYWPNKDRERPLECQGARTRGGSARGSAGHFHIRKEKKPHFPRGLTPLITCKSPNHHRAIRSSTTPATHVLADGRGMSMAASALELWTKRAFNQCQSGRRERQGARLGHRLMSEGTRPHRL